MHKNQSGQILLRLPLIMNTWNKSSCCVDGGGKNPLSLNLGVTVFAYGRSHKAHMNNFAPRCEATTAQIHSPQRLEEV